MIEPINPFAIVKASDYSDEEINSLWVDLGTHAIENIIEPKAKISKLLLGGKGTGKTHLLRYFSYPVIRLRHSKVTGIQILEQQKFLAVFLRATGIDASRFTIDISNSNRGQQLFGVYFELKLLESLLHSLCDIKNSSKEDSFDDKAFVNYLAKFISSDSFYDISTIEGFYKWVVKERKTIDDKVNNAAFTGVLDIHISFSVGSLCIPISKALCKWHSVFNNTALVYLIDEIENLSAEQQQVINTFVRYSENQATFRITGRLYALKTLKTLANGEENREGSEFKTVILDDILRTHKYFPDFANEFIRKRLSAAGLFKNQHISGSFNPRDYFEEINNSHYFSEPIEKLKFKTSSNFIETFTTLLTSYLTNQNVNDNLASIISQTLTYDLPILIQKLNILIFCKKFKLSDTDSNLLKLANSIKHDSDLFITENSSKSYKTAYEHYANDLFAQLCRESTREENVPYAGFDTFVKMSSGNPRNLLIVLGKAYSIATFRNIDFINKPKLSIEMQTQAAIEASNFLFEVDTNLGTQTDDARTVTNRLATLLRTARYSLNIPEVSPLAFSFEEEDLSPISRDSLKLALNYSFLFEIKDGRPDRNSQKLHRKIQLNPLLSPRWGLSVGRRGDLSINAELLNSIFDPTQADAFDIILKKNEARWSNPFRKTNLTEIHQAKLF